GATVTLDLYLSYVHIPVQIDEAETVLADFAGTESDCRTANEPPRNVDDPHRAQRSRFGPQGGQDAKALQHGQRRQHERSGTQILARPWPRQGHVMAGLGQKECCEKAGRPGSGDKDRMYT